MKSGQATLQAIDAAALGPLIHRPHSYAERLDIAALFPLEQPLEIELGSGDGSFLARYAALNPARNFLAVERLLGRLRKLDRKAQRAGLSNLRLLRIEAAYCLEYLLACESTAALHIYFPDPWPKRKHWKNRLVNERFPELVWRALVNSGVIYFRTDDAIYFSQIKEVFAAAGDKFQPVQTPANLSQVVTDFERQFQSRCVPTLRAAYRKSASSHRIG